MLTRVGGQRVLISKLCKRKTIRKRACGLIREASGASTAGSVPRSNWKCWNIGDSEKRADMRPGFALMDALSIDEQRSLADDEGSEEL
jgi:hypothetical protein